MVLHVQLKPPRPEGGAGRDGVLLLESGRRRGAPASRAGEPFTAPACSVPPATAAVDACAQNLKPLTIQNPLPPPAGAAWAGARRSMQCAMCRPQIRSAPPAQGPGPTGRPVFSRLGGNRKPATQTSRSALGQEAPWDSSPVRAAARVRQLAGSPGLAEWTQRTLSRSGSRCVREDSSRVSR